MLFDCIFCMLRLQCQYLLFICLSAIASRLERDVAFRGGRGAKEQCGPGEQGGRKNERREGKVGIVL